MECTDCKSIILYDDAATLVDAGGPSQENKVARGHEHVPESNVQTACSVPRDPTWRDAPLAKS